MPCIILDWKLSVFVVLCKLWRCCSRYYEMHCPPIHVSGITLNFMYASYQRACDWPESFYLKGTLSWNTHNNLSEAGQYQQNLRENFNQFFCFLCCDSEPLNACLMHSHAKMTSKSAIFIIGSRLLSHMYIERCHQIQTPSRNFCSRTYWEVSQTLQLCKNDRSVYSTNIS